VGIVAVLDDVLSAEGACDVPELIWLGGESKLPRLFCSHLSNRSPGREVGSSPGRASSSSSLPETSNQPGEGVWNVASLPAKAGEMPDLRKRTRNPMSTTSGSTSWGSLVRARTAHLERSRNRDLSVGGCRGVGQRYSLPVLAPSSP